MWRARAKPLHRLLTSLRVTNGDAVVLTALLCANAIALCLWVFARNAPSAPVMYLNNPTELPMVGRMRVRPDIPRQSIRALIGIQTSTAQHAAEHRAVIRSTWLKDRAAWDSKGFVARFFVGHRALALEYTPIFTEYRAPQDPCHTPPDAVADEAFASVQPALRTEVAKFRDLVFLPVPDSAEQRGRRAMLFFEYAWLMYDFDFAIKVDSDVYMQLPLLEGALQEWKSRDAGYIGKMAKGEVIRDPHLDWWEPQHDLFPDSYSLHATGAFYALSPQAIALVSSLPHNCLRPFVNEDVAMGLWVLTMDVGFHDDETVLTVSCDDGIGLMHDWHPPYDSTIARLKYWHAKCVEGAGKNGVAFPPEAQVVDKLVRRHQAMVEAQLTQQASQTGHGHVGGGETRQQWLRFHDWQQQRQQGDAVSNRIDADGQALRTSTGLVH